MIPALILALGLFPQTQVRVTTSLSQEVVSQGQLFELTIQVETGGAPADVVLGRLPAGLEIVQTSEGYREQSAFPSGRLRVETRTYGLVSRVPGTFVLPTATVRVEGREYRSESRVITVRPPESIATSTSAPPRLELAVEPTRAYVGQAVLLEADAMFPRNIRSRLTRPATYEPPAAPGFWVVDLPSPMTLQLEPFGDEVYEVQTYRRVYVPIIPGTHVLAPARLTYEVRAGLLQPPQSLMVESDSVILEVAPLPDAGRPDAFAGAVGTFSMQAQVVPAEVASGEAATVEVDIRGNGDVKAISAPALTTGNGVEILPPTEQVDEELAGTDIGGHKRFSWAVIPRESGRQVLGPVEFAYFDPDAGEYRVLRSDSLVLNVTGFSGSEETQGLSPVDTTPSPPGLGFVRTPAFAVAQTIPALLLLIAWLRRRREAGVGQGPLETGKADFAGEIRRLRQAVGQGTGPADELAAVLRDILARTAEGEPDIQRREVERLLDEVDRIRFAGREGTGFEDLLDRAEKMLARKTSGGVGQKGKYAPLLLILLAAAPANAQTGAVSHFDRGLAALDSRDVTAARQAFTDHLRSNPRDASAWYNLGIAAYRDGDRGAATHAWLQALTLAPRRADARTNVLTVAGSGSGRLLPSRMGLRFESAALLVAFGWWLGVLAVLFLRGRSMSVGLGIAAAVATVAIAAWALPRTAPDVAVVRADGTAIRGEPALQADAIRPFVAGEPLEILARSGGWVRVRSAAGDEGWLESVNLRFVSVQSGQVFDKE